MTVGYLCLVLHAHLPYVRHPEHEDFLEERWLYEAITESYIPLLLVFESLIRDGIDFRLTLSITPTLLSMLNDPLLRTRYMRHLDRLCDLAEREVVRTQSSPEFYETAVMYRDRLSGERDAYANRWHMDLSGMIVSLQRSGNIELIASAATHAYLPLLRVNPVSVQAQIALGTRFHADLTGAEPAGFWLPECGFYPGLDECLRRAGVQFFFAESHALENADNHGVYAPLQCPSGVFALGRDRYSSKQVWSSVEGYPGDRDYREYYRDIGFDLDLEYLKPYIQRDGIRTNTGIKYYRITGTEQKAPYRRSIALRKAAMHAHHFLQSRQQQLARLAKPSHSLPIIVAPYDAELFGHWWFEGSDWLDLLLRAIAQQDGVRLITASEYLGNYSGARIGMPSASSWGNEGYSAVWLNPANDWIYPHLHAACDRMEELARTFTSSNDANLRALNQAARELLLSQASDWAFIMTRQTAVNYAVQRTKDHLIAFNALYDMLKGNSVRQDWLADLERRNNIFPNLDYRIFSDSPPSSL